ncbi:hypothetical protein E6R60_26305 [Streptomyces sp. A0642]|uniref:hypothetical protein n=1 Tax=Streptomyces sp. A0642 TaxID=2563100 RepID=UPI0010A244C6|nr:hypothetical protein [Streptomyces sp. A0642]THA72448.1 hypothetical protein E6R60_26305 [Streptomyces sp. A0642]
MTGQLQLVGRPEHVTLSTSTALLPYRRRALVIYDVNGYYRALGADVRATRRELADAYRATGGNDPYATYAFRQLLNTRTRAAYDEAPPGELFPDRYVYDEILRRAALRAQVENALYGTEKTANDIFESLGIGAQKSNHEFLDSVEPDGFDKGRTRDRQPSIRPPATWLYSYLQLATTCDDTVRLTQWQEGLSRTLASQGTCPQFAVGFHAASDQPFLVSKDLGIPVFFLHERVKVTGELIAAAANAAIT